MKRMKPNSFLKSSFWTIVLVLLSSTLFAQIRGNGNVVQNQRDVSEFSGIVIKSGIDLFVSQGDKSSLEIKADENLQQYIISEVKDKILYVYVEKGKNIWNSKAMDAYVTVKDVNSIKVSGGGDVESQSTIKSDAIKIGISGGGDLEFNLEAQKAYCNVSGGGDVELSGNVKNFKAEISGGGDLEMNIECQKLYTEISGGGDAEIEAGSNVNTAKVKVSGGGDLGLVLVSQELDLSMSGGGDASLSGGTEKFEAVVKNGGDLYATDFKVKTAYVQLSGGSDAKLQVSDNLHVTASGGGQIYVSGNPQIDANLSGGSKVHQK